jgi:hypothetical protein
MAESIKLFLPSGEAKYSCEQGWTAKLRTGAIGHYLREWRGFAAQC